MKKIFITTFLALLCGVFVSAQGTAKKELVSQRIADAITSGKYYMKLKGALDIDDEDGNISMMPVMEIAAKGGVSMLRISELSTVSLIVNGYSYQLDEKSKTYMPMVSQAGEPDLNFGKLTFNGQGKCKLNGKEFYYDCWRSSDGRTIKFYYNSAKVSAVDFGLKEQGFGVMNLLAFDTRIPEKMYFCLSSDWKKSNMAGGGAMAGIDTEAMMAQALSQIDPSELPEGVDIKALMSGGGIDIRKMIEQELGGEELPEGVSLDDLMNMAGMGGQSTSSSIQMLEMSKQQNEEINSYIEMMRGQGIPDEQLDYMKKSMMPDANMYDQSINALKQQEARTQAMTNAPEPPKCSDTWLDTSTGCQLAAGGDMGVITVSESHPTDRPYIYKDDLEEPTLLAVDMSKDVTDEGIWQAFDALVAETEGMTEEQAVDHIMEQCGILANAAEMHFVTGEVIERAVAICMLVPSVLTYNNAGLLFFYTGDTKNALTYYQEAEKQDKDNPTVLANIAECFLELGDRAAARRYAERAVNFAPDFGLAYQILTTINLAEGKYVAAAETLFRSAENHFSEITARQFYSLIMALSAGPLKVCEGFDHYKLFHLIFSEKNLELLTIATQAGFEKREGLDVPSEQIDLPWLIPSGKLQYVYPSLGERRKEMDEKVHRLMDDGERLLEKNKPLQAILAMGMNGYKGELGNLENMARSMASYNFKMPDIPEIDIYASASAQARGTYDGCYLLDARQYWCLQMWKAYYEGQYDYLQGYWYCEDKGLGKRPDALVQRNENKDIALEFENTILKTGLEKYYESTRRCQKAYDDCVASSRSELEELRCKEQYLRCMISCGVILVRDYYAVVIGNVVDTDRPYYEQYEKPLLEEYWLRMNAMSSYCEDIGTREYILNEVSQFINGERTKYMFTAEQFGLNIDQWWTQYVRTYEQELKEVIAEINYIDQPVIPVIEKSGGELKDYGEKERTHMGFAIPTPWGRVGYQHNGDQYGFFHENEASGTTTFWGEDGREEELETYDCLADNPHAPDQGGYAQVLGKWAAQKGAKDMVGKAAKGLGLGGVTALIPVNKSSSKRQRARVVDSQGNVSSSGISHTDSRTIGVDALNVTKTRKVVRSGNAVRTVNHVGYTFMGLIEINETW